MPYKRAKFYTLSSIMCLTGYAWLLFSLITRSALENKTEICIIKHVTGIPCPSCGSTRSILSLLQGKILEALYWNPIGILLFIIMVLSPLWLLYDYVKRKETLLNFYERMELSIKRKRIAIPCILIITAIWIWNICKGL